MFGRKRDEKLAKQIQQEKRDHTAKISEAIHNQDQTKKSDWYWVKVGDEWFPALKDDRAANGWTNNDTWEDFYDEVTENNRIPYPDEVT
jgi:hypothetical protein